MIALEVTDLRFRDPEGKTIACKVLFESQDEAFSSPINFVASSLDTESHGVELFNRIIAGEFGPVEPYKVDNSALIQLAKEEKTALMNEAVSQITILQYALDQQMIEDDELVKLNALKRYVVLLNRVESQAGYPNTINWPEVP